MDGLSKEFIDAIPVVAFQWDNYRYLHKLMNDFVSEDGKSMKYLEAALKFNELHSSDNDTDTILEKMDKRWDSKSEEFFNQVKDINIESRLLCIEVGEFEDNYDTLLYIQGCTKVLMNLHLQGWKNADKSGSWVERLRRLV
jgi:hypothetical protein